MLPIVDALRTAVDNELAVGLKFRCESGLGLLPAPPPGPFFPGGPGGPGGRPPGGPGSRDGRPPGPGPRGYELFIYAADGTSPAINAPPLPSATLSTFWTGVGRGLQLRFDIGGAGDCAVGLARMLPRPGQLRDQLVAVALVLLSVLGGVWMAAGPVISRMRRLADAVRRSAASTYDQPVQADGDDEVAVARARPSTRPARRCGLSLQDVQAREETLRQFVADTTHDVAIPMSVLQGHLSSLEGALDGIGDDATGRTRTPRPRHQGNPLHHVTPQEPGGRDQARRHQCPAGTGPGQSRGAGRAGDRAASAAGARLERRGRLRRAGRAAGATDRRHAPRAGAQQPGRQRHPLQRCRRPRGRRPR